MIICPLVKEKTKGQKMNKAFVESFGMLEDPRVERTKKHALLDIIAIAMIGIMAGAQSF